MTDKAVYGVTEDGTYSTTGPAVSLSGGFSSRYAIAQLFFVALSDGETVTVTILHDQNNWAIYSGAQFIAGTPNSLDLSGAILKDSAGTLNDSDAVEVFSFAPPDRPAQKAETVTTADVTGQINTHHVCTIAGLTAERNFILPAPVNYGAGKVADRIRVTVTDGDADYELVIKGDTGITINGGSAATEWSRLFIAAETVELEATSATNWQVVDDGRIKQAGRLYRTSTQTVTGGADALVQNNNVDYLIGLIADTSTSYSLKARRAGRYVTTGFTRFISLSSGDWVQLYFSIAGVYNDPRSGRSYLDGATGSTPLITHTMPMQLAAGEAVAMAVYHTHGSGVNLGSATWSYPSLQLIEL